MFKFIIASITSLFVLSSCSRSFDCDDLQYKYSDIMKSLKTKSDTSNFIGQLQYLLNKNPKCVRAYHLLGFIEINQMNYSTAESVFEESLKISPSSIYSLYNLAYLFNIEGENEKALNLINSAIRKKSEVQSVDLNNFFSKEFDIELSELLFLRGVIFYDMELIESAKNNFLLTEKRKYNLDETYLYLSNSYYYLKKEDSACFYARKISKLENKIINQIVFKECF